MLPLLGLIACALAVVGVLVVVTGRHLGSVSGHRPDQEPDPTGRTDRVAAWMDDSLGRTGRAVDVLTDRRPDQEVLRRRTTPRQRRSDYLVMGSGLLGLAAVMVLGVVLMLVG